MDIESFSQCMAYMQSLAQSKSNFERALPIVGTIAGAILGFTLNFISTSYKESKATKNKIMCNDEEVHRINNSLEHLIQETSRLLLRVVSKEHLTDHRLPSKINSTCIDKYFTDVAHKYSQNQRYWLQLLLSQLKDINSKLSDLQSIDTTKKFITSKTLLSTIAVATFASRLCEMILTNMKIPDHEIIEKLKALKIPDETLEAYLCAERNADNQNSVLGL